MLELLVSCGVFLTVLFVAFACFHYGSQACRVSNLRANVQTAATRAMLSLQSDLRRSAVPTISITNRAFTFSGVRVYRDAVSLGAVADWSNPANFNTSTGAPIFDRYIVYYATKDDERGKLYRCVVNNPNAADPVLQPITSWSEASRFNDAPAANVNEQIGFSLLSDEVRQLHIDFGASPNSIKVDLILSREGDRGPTGGAHRFDQTYELQLDLVPHNTPSGD